jgi:magnesium-transporting ATPase (P-type)
LTAKVQRLRGQALWLMIVGAIGFLSCSLGIFQYWMYGVVSIRPGHQPVSGSAAVELLIFIGSISALFFTFGIVLRFRARILSSRF